MKTKHRLEAEVYVQEMKEIHRTIRFTLCFVLGFLLILIGMLFSPESLELILDFIPEIFLRVRN